MNLIKKGLSQFFLAPPVYARVIDFVNFTCFEVSRYYPIRTKQINADKNDRKLHVRVNPVGTKNHRKRPLDVGQVAKI